jgi:hypothetical protein
MLILNGSYKGKTVTITKETFEQCTSHKSLLYDKKGEEHYNLISALHKSMRNSDPDAAVYWLARMLEAGEDPIYIARRVTRFAAEDVGLADPHALGDCGGGFPSVPVDWHARMQRSSHRSGDLSFDGPEVECLRCGLCRRQERRLDPTG